MSFKAIELGCTVTLQDLDTLEDAVITIGQGIGLPQQSTSSPLVDHQIPINYISSWEEYYRYQHWAEKVKEKVDNRAQLSPLQQLLLAKTIGDIIKIGGVRYKVINISK